MKLLLVATSLFREQAHPSPHWQVGPQTQSLPQPMEGTNFDFGRHLQGGAQLQLGEQIHPSQPLAAFSTASPPVDVNFVLQHDVDDSALRVTQAQLVPQHDAESLFVQEQFSQVQLGPQQHEYVK